MWQSSAQPSIIRLVFLLQQICCLRQANPPQQPPNLATSYDASNVSSRRSGQSNQASKHFDSMMTFAQQAAVVKKLQYKPSGKGGTPHHLQNQNGPKGLQNCPQSLEKGLTPIFLGNNKQRNKHKFCAQVAKL